MDIILSLMSIIGLAPVLLLVAVLVRKKLGKPVIFTQERPGLNEKIFKLYKFRTMTDERDKNGELLSDEVRLTPFGKFLRSTSLDELPQLINILKGEMSFIGPRALLKEYLPYYSEEERLRHSVRPGLTNLVSINGRNSVCVKDKFKYDIEYVKNLSFFMDFNIFFRTFYVVFCRKGTQLEQEEKYMDYFNSREKGAFVK